MRARPARGMGRRGVPPRKRRCLVLILVVALVLVVVILVVALVLVLVAAVIGTTVVVVIAIGGVCVCPER